MYAITSDERAGARFLNFFRLEDNFIVHRQVEQRDELTFMRAKRRSL